MTGSPQPPRATRRLLPGGGGISGGAKFARAAFRTFSRRVLSIFVLFTVILLGCSSDRDSRPPLVVIGVDGFDWKVLGPLVLKGEVPNLTMLAERGEFGSLKTMRPTLSPVIWTTIGTGKGRLDHGITSFYKTDKKTGSRRLLTNRDRKSKAIWNIASDYGLRTLCIGWWLTYPVEEIEGVMVAQTNTEGQIKAKIGVPTRKGTLLRGLSGQVHPRELQNRIMEMAEKVDSRIEEEAERVFGSFGDSMSELDASLWGNTLWAFRADVIYGEVAEELLEREGAFDLVLVYFGGPDVVGHRFWRHRFPDDFEHPPGPKARETFGNVIEDYYRYVDDRIGRILEHVRAANVLVVSDHGMESVHERQQFKSVMPPGDALSGDHLDAPAGVIIVGGPHIARGASVADLEPELRTGDLPEIGGVLDIAPTILALLGLPIGKDMKGTVLERVVAPDFLQRHPPEFVSTHEDAAWRKSRRSVRLDPQIERERMEQLRSLGYID